MRSLGLLVLTVALGCFDDSNPVGGSGATSSGSSTGAPGSSDGGTAGLETTATVGNATTGLDSSTSAASTGSDSGDDPCAEGTEDCTCAPGSECDPGLECLRGVCMAMPSTCLVSYSGQQKLVEYRVATVFADGTITDPQLQSFPAVHGGTEVYGTIGNPDMLVACGEHLYAAIADTAEVQVLQLQPDQTLLEIERFSLALDTGITTLRGLECATPDAMVAALVYSEAVNSVRLQGVQRSKDGTLSVVGSATVRGTMGLPPMVRTAWSPLIQRGYVAWVNPPNTNSTELVSFELDGALVTNASGPLQALNMQGRVGAIATDASGTFLAGAGLRDGGSAYGLAARWTLSPAGGLTNPPSPMILGDDPLLFNASSLELPGGGLPDTTGVLVSDGELATVHFEPAPAGLSLGIRRTIGTGPGRAFPAFDDSMVVIATADEIRTYPYAVLTDTGTVEPLEVMRFPLGGHTASAMLPCPE